MSEMITIDPKTDVAIMTAAQFAVDVQDACNGRAVLSALVRHLDAIQNRGGDFRNQNPVTIAVLDKMASLAHIQNLTISSAEDKRVDAAHEACRELAEGKSVEWEIFPIR